MSGKLIISLDFELMWGVRDKKTIANYGSNILNVHNTLPVLLDLFREYDIKATFAVVGFLFAKDREELINYIPKIKPNYLDKNLSPYNGYLESIGENEDTDKYNFGLSLIQKILDEDKHEICTHTFSHYYCKEEGQDNIAFYHDLNQAILIAKKLDLRIESIIFPRNQYNSFYDKELQSLGIKVYRGNERSWYYSPKEGKNDALSRRILRLMDSYVNISGHNCFRVKSNDEQGLIDMPSSRFLRPYNKKLKMFEPLRLNRIKSSMTYAAKNKLNYHLWWHPHNFGSNERENFNFLTQVLEHYKFLKGNYDFNSTTMIGAVKKNQ
ncbi:polysaccharide deacetylase family protein [Seonamhaeicola sediminis]|uniref:Polysaccharide deacetylase family protein n=1 Tax=Seonamhaeicola sediminis TaxID=2528206 RepID=A0A562YGJ5_9FLAO|nr:polysaccharide deacetylase family protein [Seonamhaeicola sediminis]TWO33979.1 polysaccharide deacetylase family protein [Seonamhaeicola sediminis]